MYVTVSAGTAGAKSVLKNPVRRAKAEQAIENFVNAHGLDGVDLDFEPNKWSPTLWAQYMDFVGHIAADSRSAGTRRSKSTCRLGHRHRRDASRYADPVAVGARLVVMAYDHEYDIACAPITPYCVAAAGRPLRAQPGAEITR